MQARNIDRLDFVYVIGDAYVDHPSFGPAIISRVLEDAGYTVGIPSLGSKDTIAPAVSQGNETLLNWLNEEIVALGEENFFHADYEATLVDTYGMEYEDSLVVEGGVTE